MKKCLVSYDEVVSLENLLAAWEEFIRGKRSRLDVADFKRHLADQIIALHTDLVTGEYRHGGYDFFTVTDPKQRNIHKATVRDRLLHHALHRKLYPHFASKFIAGSFSCQVGKGLHRALESFKAMSGRVSRNNTSTCWFLKCDIRKFFDSIEHNILLKILKREIDDVMVAGLLSEIVKSFETKQGCGLPLGNLTSQLLANVYMNEFDQFVKHRLRQKYYVRYADDFVFLSESRSELLFLIPKISKFLAEQLCLKLHPKKIFLRTLHSGVDFLGWVHFPYHSLPRATTRLRISRRSGIGMEPATLQSYLGLLQHGDAFGLQQEIENDAWLWMGCL